MIKLGYPPAEMQIRRWKYHLNECGGAEEAIIEMVEKHPMHISEIDFYVEQAKLESILSVPFPFIWSSVSLFFRKKNDRRLSI